MPAPPYGDRQLIRNNNQQNGRRRGRGGGGGGQNGMAPRAGGGQNYGNNRLDIRQRGNATQLLDKYKTLARDAAQQGDRVVAEYYLQYADHYFRVLNEIRERQPEHQRGPRPGYDADDEDGDMNGGYNQGYAGAGNPEPARQDNRSGDGDGPDGQPRYDNGGRDDGNGRDDRQRDERTRGYERQETRDRDDTRSARDDGARSDQARSNQGRDDGRGEEGRRDDGRRDEGGGDSRRDQRRDRGFNGRAEGGRGDVPRDRGDRNIAHEEVPFADESPIAGLPGPATLAVTEAPAASDEEAPKRRRGRPRKVVDAAADPVDA